MSSIKSLRDLTVHTLKDVYYAEKQILKKSPKMAENSDSSKLADLFRQHETDTQTHIDRLEKAFKAMGEEASGVKCYAIEGILKEVDEVIDETDDADTLDAGLIMTAQAAATYEITRYGTLASWARTLGLDEVRNLLEENLVEAKDTDSRLTRIAEDKLNKQAVS